MHVDLPHRRRWLQTTSIAEQLARRTAGYCQRAMALDERLPDGADADDPDSATGTTLSRADIELTGEFLIRLHELSIFLTRMLELAQRDDFASNVDLIVLVSLRLDGPSRPRRLAEVVGFSSGGMTNLLDRLQAAGWVRRRHGVAGDGRAVIVELTHVGIAAVERTRAASETAFAAARPLLERMADLLIELGVPVRRRKLPNAGDLASIRRLAEVGHLYTTAIAGPLGPLDDAPQTLQTLWFAVREGGVRPTSIAAMNGLSSAGTTSLIDRLESRGLVRRSSANLSDGRAVAVIATSKGRRSLVEAILRGRPVLGQISEVLFVS